MLNVYYTKISDFLSHFYPGEICDNPRAVRKWNSRIGEYILAAGLSRFFRLKEGDYRLLRHENGKPYVDVPGCYFNISHSGDYVACAFSDREVGLDIEKIRNMPERVARRYFHPREVEYLESKDKEQQTEIFFRLWSVKESYVKYLGEGIKKGLSSFRVDLENTPIRIIENDTPLPLSIHPCPIDPHYVCFICTETPFPAEQVNLFKI